MEVRNATDPYPMARHGLRYHQADPGRERRTHPGQCQSLVTGVKTGEFPQPLKVGGRTVWRVSDIDEPVARLQQPGSVVPRSRRVPPPLRRASEQTAEK